ncbi:pectinesterase inhibitor 9-like [Bidens hawaiensis]|uniref:pectinesterase inhibitor 9-like n=1 Tax=Bidens hawaiensis TaxID=980011 RepID=UPI00404ABF1F
MSHLVLHLLLISFTIFGFSPIVESRSRARMYLELQCRSALYRDLCVQTLLPYVTKTGLPDPQLLAQISLASCLSKARFTKTYLNMAAKKLNETNNIGNDQAVEECLRQINDGVSQITQSFKELQQIRKDGDENFGWHESNVVSWVSAALTGTETCVDGILAGGVGKGEQAMIKARVVNVKQLASNSLAMFSRFTMRYRASRGIKNPKILL